MHDETKDCGDLHSAPSRSAARRAALDVLRLAKELVELTPRELDRIPLPDALREQVTEAKRIASQIAHKRQVQFLAKQLRRYEELLPTIRASLAAPKLERRRAAAALHRVEAWRDRLLRDGDAAIEELLATLPDLDRRQLRNLVRAARAEAAANQPPAAARRLFRLIQAAFGEAIEPQPILPSQASSAPTPE